MPKISKIVSLLLMLTTFTQLNCMNRLFRSLQGLRTAFSSLPRLSVNSLARASIFNSTRFISAMQCKKTTLFFHNSSQHTTYAWYFTHTWNKFFAKANDPVKFEKELRDAINKDDIQAVKQVIKRDQKLLQQNDNLSVRAKHSVPYLIQASEHGNTQIIDALLLICKSEINLMFENPLVRFDRTRRLPSADHDYVTPLSMAVQHHNYQAALTLLKNGANPNMFTGDLKYPTVLARAAIKYHDIEMVKLLLEHGALVECHGQNILMLAKNRFVDHDGKYEQPILDLLETYYLKQI
jgi:hypothetical protein